ncbi:hypothetical protein [Aestuariivirga sp.]|uniref:hypothetical protein n=1 Tax=Aestuariivirga sp. TaxID=2650926 RepID=UPI003BAA3F84
MPPPGGPEEVRLHIGAHKTATTHLQDNLEAQQRALIEGGCLYLPRDRTRSAGLLRAIFANHLNGNPQTRKSSLGEFLTLPPGLPRRFLLSEEDILGSAVDLLTGFYPHARARLLPFAGITRPESRRVFLSIRNYADLLPSVYSQALRDGSSTITFTQHLNRWLEAPPSWVELIETIGDVLGPANVTVWTLEFYLRNPAAILQRVSGVDVPEVKHGIPGDTTRLTAGAIRRIEALDPAMNLAQRRQAAQQLIAEERAGERYDPLSAEQKAILTARYQSDLARLAALPVTFLG